MLFLKSFLDFYEISLGVIWSRTLLKYYTNPTRAFRKWTVLLHVVLFIKTKDWGSVTSFDDLWRSKGWTVWISFEPSVLVIRSAVQGRWGEIRHGIITKSNQTFFKIKHIEKQRNASFVELCQYLTLKKENSRFVLAEMCLGNEQEKNFERKWLQVAISTRLAR